MSDIAQRFLQNPLLKPIDLNPSSDELVIVSLLNPGVFTFNHKTWLLVRVAENAVPKAGYIGLPQLNDVGKIDVNWVTSNHPDLITDDARVVTYKGADYLTTVSHLRLLCSDDGVNFKEDQAYPPLFGSGFLEKFGIEDCRVTQIADQYFLTYTAVSANGVGVGLRTTTDWQIFSSKGMILPPHNKDCAFFEEQINGKYYALHRPSSVAIGGNYIWLAESPDALHWGNHKCIVKIRDGMWDNSRIGAGASPIKTPIGWLAIYHGANENNRYGLGVFLLDLNDPSILLGRTAEPIMMPKEDYELYGFFGEVVFTNGHVINGDELTIYYGAADEFVCAANFSIKEILAAIIYN